MLHGVRGFDKPTKIFESKASVPVDPLWEQIANSHIKGKDLTQVPALKVRHPAAIAAVDGDFRFQSREC